MATTICGKPVVPLYSGKLKAKNTLPRAAHMGEDHKAYVGETLDGAMGTAEASITWLAAMSGPNSSWSYSPIDNLKKL